MALGLKQNIEEELNQQDAEQTKLRRRERHLRLLAAKKNPPSEYFYQVGNPSELTRIGQAFLEDFKTGVKSFAVTSTDYKSSQQRTVLALACYFDHLIDMKILVISDTLEQGILSEVMEGSKVEYLDIPDSTSKLEINHFNHHFDLVDLNKLQALNVKNKPNYEYEVILQNLLNSYDIIFWDTPTLNTFKNMPYSYAQTLGFIESLTIIVSQAASHSKDVNELTEYFSSFGVNIKGVVFDKLQVAETKKKTKWWRIFSF